MREEVRSYRMDKLLIARNQLLTAIELFFEDKDAVSIHTLAGASSEILEQLCREAKKEPFMEHMKMTFPNKPIKEIRDAQNLYKNAFKHANRSDSEVISQFHETVNDFMIYVATTDYLRLRNASPVPTQVFEAWFNAVHEDRLSPNVEKARYRDVFPNILSMTRAEQKSIGKKAIELYLSDPELNADPRTEPLMSAP